MPLEFGQTVNGIGTGPSGSNLDDSYLSNQCGDPNIPQQVNTPNGPILTNYGKCKLEGIQYLKFCRRKLYILILYYDTKYLIRYKDIKNVILFRSLSVNVGITTARP